MKAMDVYLYFSPKYWDSRLLPKYQSIVKIVLIPKPEKSKAIQNHQNITRNKNHNKGSQDPKQYWTK